MEKTKLEELAGLLNTALGMEIAAAVQYGAHAENVHGLFAETVMARLKDSQHDEEKHADVLRGLIGDYCKAYPTMDMGVTSTAFTTNAILTSNIDTEKAAIAQYQVVLDFLKENEEELQPIFQRVFYDVKMIMIEEQEHVAELERLQ